MNFCIMLVYMPNVKCPAHFSTLILVTMKIPSEIHTYESFCEEMKTPGFAMLLKAGLDILVEKIEKEDLSWLCGDDERMVKYWVRYHDEQKRIAVQAMADCIRDGGYDGPETPDELCSILGLI